MTSGMRARRPVRRATMLATAWGLAAVAAAAFGCSVHDDFSPHEWVPFEAITGSLQPELANPAPAPPPPAGRLRIVTFNVHLGPDIPGLAAAFQDDAALREADVILLEEIDAHPSDGETQAARLAGILGLNHAYAPAFNYPDGGSHGLACLSRFTIGDARVLELPFLDLVVNSERRIALGVTIAVGDRPLGIVVVHLDTRVNVNDRLKQLLPAVERADPASVLAGDFNILPFVFVDRVIPLLPQSAAAPVDTPGSVDELMRSNGFAAPTSGSGGTLNGILDARLDSIYTRGYVPLGFGVERSVTVSDHFPVWLDIAWAP